MSKESDYTLPSDQPPNRKILSFAHIYYRIAQYGSAMLLIIGVTLLVPNWGIRVMATIWFVAFIGYFVLRSWLIRTNSDLMKETTVGYHGILGIIGIALMYISFRKFGYGIWESDPLNIWWLVIIPLTLVARYGSTEQWWPLFLLAIFFQIGFRMWYVFERNLLDPTTFAPNGNVLVLIFVQTIIIILASIGSLVILRWRRMKQIQARTLWEVSASLSHMIDHEEKYITAAETIRNKNEMLMVQFPYVFILRWDPTINRLVVVGGAGKEKDYWGNVKIKRGEGITGRVFESGKYINCLDVRRLKPGEFTCPLGFEDIRSEAAVPIRYQGDLIGVLDVQSEKKSDFDSNDIELLNILAAGLGISFGHKRTRDAYQLASKTLVSGDNIPSSGVRERKLWFSQISEAAIEHLGVSSLVLFRLAPATGYPLSPPYIWPSVKSNVTFEEAWPIPDRSYFWRLLYEWETVFGFDSEKFQEKSERNSEDWARKYLIANKFKTIAFLPIGEYEPLASLFLCYDKEKRFSDIDKLALTTFASVFEHSYRRVIRAPEDFSKFGSTVHEVVIPETQYINSNIDQIMNNIENPVQITKYLEQAQKGLKRLRERTAIAAISSTHHYNPPHNDLHSALLNVGSLLTQNRDEKTRVEISGTELLTDEHPDLLLILYRIAGEAIGNSIEHGKAKNVNIQFSKTRKRITSEIVDDGTGLKKDHSKKRPHGIYYWKKIIRWEFGGKLSLHSLNGSGTRVFLEIPIRPI